MFANNFWWSVVLNGGQSIDFQSKSIDWFLCEVISEQTVKVYLHGSGKYTSFFYFNISGGKPMVSSQILD